MGALGDSEAGEEVVPMGFGFGVGAAANVHMAARAAEVEDK